MFHFGPLQFLLYLALIPVALIPSIFYALTLHRALARCAPESRAMEPGMVWLMFVPLFNLIWNFVVVNRVSDSLEREFHRRGAAGPVDTGRGVGIATCALICVSLIPLLGILTSLIALVCWILYWAKVANLSGRLLPPLGSAQPSAPIA